MVTATLGFTTPGLNGVPTGRRVLGLTTSRVNYGSIGFEFNDFLLTFNDVGGRLGRTLIYRPF